MHGNYVRSLFTIETGHGMRSSLSKECICDGRVFKRADVQYIYVRSIQGRSALLKIQFACV